MHLKNAVSFRMFRLIDTLRNYLFSGCSYLKYIIIPENITTINMGAFNYCIGLEKLVIPSTIAGFKVTSISEDAFRGRTEITGVNFPDTLKTVGGNAFLGCNSIKSVVIPESVTELCDNAFYSCMGMTDITIPKGVTTFGNHCVGYYYNSRTRYTILDNFTIHGDEGSEAQKYAEYNKITFAQIETELINNSYPLTVRDYIDLGDSFDVRGVATGGTAPYTYAYYYKKKTDTKWVTAKDYSSTTQVTIKPNVATAYDICVKVMDSKGTVVKKYFDINVKGELSNSSKISATSINLGNTITAKGGATGGTAPYTYAYYYKKETYTLWVTAKDYSTTTSVAIKPNVATEYNVCIKVKDSTGTIVKKYLNFKVTAVSKLANTSTISAISISLGNSITAKGAATGGTAPYKYAYFYKKKTDTKWVIAKDYSTATSVAIKPNMAKDYDICVKVKDSTGTVAKKYFTASVTK